MDLFEFAQTQQQTKHIKRPTKEEILAYIEEVYSKYGKYLGISKDKYTECVLKEYEQIQNLTDEEYRDYLEAMQVRTLQMLRASESRIISILEAQKKAVLNKKQRSVFYRIRNFLSRIFKK